MKKVFKIQKAYTNLLASYSYTNTLLLAKNKENNRVDIKMQYNIT